MAIDVDHTLLLTTIQDLEGNLLDASINTQGGYLYQGLTDEGVLDKTSIIDIQQDLILDASEFKLKALVPIAVHSLLLSRLVEFVVVLELAIQMVRSHSLGCKIKLILFEGQLDRSTLVEVSAFHFRHLTPQACGSASLI